MLMQESRSLGKSHTIMARFRPMTSSRIAVQQSSNERGPSNRLAPSQTFAARRISEPEQHSSGTLLPWADPYIADLQRRHEGELRRERSEGRARE